MLIFQILSAVFAGVILVTIVISRKQLREAVTSREAAYLSEKIWEWHSAEMSRVQADVIYKIRDENVNLDLIANMHPSYHMDYVRICDFFNSVAALLELEAVGELQVVEYFGSDAIYFWGLLHPFVQELRKNRKQPRLYRGFEELAKRSLYDDDRGKPFRVFNPIDRVRVLHKEAEAARRPGPTDSE